jgi:hypothetical protein
MKRKYTYLKVLQMLYDGKWHDEISADKSDKEDLKEFHDDVKSYVENTNYTYRVIERRVPNN